MFTALTSIVPTRVVLKTRTKPTHKVRSGVVAYTNWMLDGVGCSGARSDDSTLVKSKKLKNNVVHCPVKPIDLTSLCMSHDGRFEMLDALFEQHGDDIFVSNLAPMDFQHGSITMTVDGYTLASGDGVPYNYYARPAFLRVWPSAGPTTGGTRILVFGSSFGEGIGPTSCRFGSDVQPATIELRSKAMRCVTPLSAARTVPVELTLNGQQYHSVGGPRRHGHAGSHPAGSSLALSPFAPRPPGAVVAVFQAALAFRNRTIRGHRARNQIRVPRSLSHDSTQHVFPSSRMTWIR